MNSHSETQYFIGLMSGTSTDGVDGALVAFEKGSLPRIIAFSSLGMPSDLRATFLALNKAGENELQQAYLAANALADLYAQCCQQLLSDSGLTPVQITAIGAHGQTVRHRPDLGFTVQLNAPARLAELTDIDVIADFRSRDVATGGQGAPFAPLLHQALFSEDNKTRVILNLGGIANITLLAPQHSLLGFDTGPANALMDYWIDKHLGKTFDADGAWGASGEIHQELLAQLLSEPYFNKAAPKSTGRDLFNPAWLEAHLNKITESISAVDVMATLRALTTHSVAHAIHQYSTQVDEIIVCGGGVKNKALMRELQELMKCEVNAIEKYGFDSQAIEALAFAWLAKAFCDKEPLNFPTLTGSRRATIAGALYPR
ncbi:MAG: anhydro-N-acetylmuramic acid kinase [Pelistega sp.]|nr:anhydro-N-acetylmuramic acid kinase [Pelistega sp.]